MDNSTSVILKPTFHGGMSWPETPSIMQQFSLPSSIMYYLAKNPSTAELYLKMIKSCKYFFEKNPIIVVKKIDESNVCSKIYSACCNNNDEKCCVKFDINKCKSKIWLIHEMNLTGGDGPNFTSLLLPKIYQCDISELDIHYKSIKLDELKFFGSTVKIACLGCIKILNNDGSIAMLEDILDAFPKIEEFRYFGDNFPSTNASTIKKIAQLTNLENLKYLILDPIPPQTLNIKDLAVFLKDQKRAHFYLNFGDVNLSEDYKQQLDDLVDTVIECQNSKSYIRYGDVDEEKVKKMKKRFFSSV